MRSKSLVPETSYALSKCYYYYHMLFMVFISLVYFLKLVHFYQLPPCCFCLRASEDGSCPSSFTGLTEFILPQTDPNFQVSFRNLDIKILRKTYFYVCPCQLEVYYVCVCVYLVCFICTLLKAF